MFASELSEQKVNILYASASPFQISLNNSVELFTTPIETNAMGDFHDDDEEEDEVAVGKISYWHLTVHVHGKAINISCGDATQRLKWLAHVGIGLFTLLYPHYCAEYDYLFPSTLH